MKYELRVSLTPKLYSGSMQHYWHIVLITESGIYTIGDGWASTIQAANIKAETWINKNLENCKSYK